MTFPGEFFSSQSTPEELAAMTIRTMERSVPASVPVKYFFPVV
tara:strand:+ start:456 stop:584 length:129 start_codon:yes stop_codon:yes gene_type:complete